MSIRCGNHEGAAYHETVEQVRMCFAGATAETPKYGDVYLTEGQLAKIDTGIRDMEREGILPRTGRGSGLLDTARKVAKWDAECPVARPTFAGQLSPKGRKMPEEYGGSGAQYDYAYSMLEELGELDKQDWSLLGSVRNTSMAIERLKDRVRDARRLALANRTAMPAKREPVRHTITGQVTEDGIYRNPETDELFKVQVAHHGSGHLYAKQAFLSTLEGDLAEIPLDGDRRVTERITWVYKPGLLGKVKAEWRVTKEQALAFGALYGQCIRCGRDLTNEDSIEAGIGPICRGKLGF